MTFLKTIYLGQTVSELGRSKAIIKCPFCGKTTSVYIWSFAGVGKRCECGAKLGYINSSK